jgi:hypothetical protein
MVSRMVAALVAIDAIPERRHPNFLMTRVASIMPDRGQTSQAVLS